MEQLNISFDAYQKWAETTAIYPDEGNNMYYPVMGLCGEAGEVANQVKKIMRDDGGVLLNFRREKIKQEIGDTLWYLAALATEMDIKFSEIAVGNLNKLLSREAKKTLNGDGDDR